MDVNVRREEVEGDLWRPVYYPKTQFEMACKYCGDEYAMTLVLSWNLMTVPKPYLNIQRYVEDILEERVVSFAPFIDSEFVLMQGNARPSIARLVTAFSVSLPELHT